MYSDGTLTPAEIAARAKLRGLAAISITDHDTVAGCAEGERAAAAAGIEFVHGCEISAYQDGLQLHILAYLLDPRSQTLAARFAKLARLRDERNRDMLAALTGQGMEIDEDSLRRCAGSDIVTRSHFAIALRDGGYVGSIQEAFDRYIGYGGSAFVPHEGMTVRDCIEFIRGEGAIPVLAHPFLYKLEDDRAEKLVAVLAGYGLMGIEVLYASHTVAQTGLAKRWAKKHRLVETGGSDFHGEHRPHTDIGVGRGDLFVPYSVVENLRVLQQAH